MHSVQSVGIKYATSESATGQAREGSQAAPPHLHPGCSTCSASIDESAWARAHDGMVGPDEFSGLASSGARCFEVHVARKHFRI
jgi:hypothetical protein